MKYDRLGYLSYYVVCPSSILPNSKRSCCLRAVSGSLGALIFIPKQLNCWPLDRISRWNMTVLSIYHYVVCPSSLLPNSKRSWCKRVGGFTVFWCTDSYTFPPPTNINAHTHTHTKAKLLAVWWLKFYMKHDDFEYLSLNVVCPSREILLSVWCQEAVCCFWVFVWTNFCNQEAELLAVWQLKYFGEK